MDLTSKWWGDEHVQKSSVVNITNIDPTYRKHSVRISDWQLALLVCLSVMDVALVIGLLAAVR